MCQHVFVFSAKPCPTVRTYVRTHIRTCRLLSLSARVWMGSGLHLCWDVCWNTQVFAWACVSQETGVLGCVVSLRSFSATSELFQRDCVISLPPAAVRLLVPVPSLLTYSLAVALPVMVKRASLWCWCVFL